ncbi:preprotein translocase subunit SecG [Paludibacter sp. 221]|uniref:preprotein translocase subunit SecG n=1 Tax=Paludibacter sp. 221 TaxID=2302939 RepID=UPI0013CFBF24|nr:preprotein translocase subunit SecG [Paludibacter sp. 221]NDV45772.1 preprotein translocase subunit SecG [Paludibacter sp. 221]
MYILLTILIVIAAVLLTLLVLVQNSKGGGLAAGFSSSNQVLGVRKTTDFLEKATWGLTAFIIVLSIFAASTHPYSTSANGAQSEIQEQYQNALQQEPGAALPGFGEYMEEEAGANQE